LLNLERDCNPKGKQRLQRTSTRDLRVSSRTDEPYHLKIRARSNF
jgi:hypothetical protein